MFYAHFVLAKKGPLARIWLAAHWDKKLTKAQVYETNIEESVAGIMQPKVKMALRTSGHLLLGVVKIYSRKAKYLLADCNEAFAKIKMAFRPGSVDLPMDKREAAINAITLPDYFQDVDTELPYLDTFDFSDGQFMLIAHTRADEITLRDDYAGVSLATGSTDRFDDEPMSSGESMGSPEVMRDAPTRPGGGSMESAGISLVDQDISRLRDAPFGDESSIGRPSIGGISKEGMNRPTLSGIFEAGLPYSASIHEPVQSIARPLSPASSHAGGISRPATPLDDTGLAGGIDLEPVSMAPPLLDQTPAAAGDLTGPILPPAAPTPSPAPPAQHEQTTLLQNEDESFALAPIDASALKGGRRKRKRKLVVDAVKAFTGEEMKDRLEYCEDILTTLDIAPPTKKLMKWLEIGGVDELFSMPCHPLPKGALFDQYKKGLFMRETDDDPFSFIRDHPENDIQLEHISPEKEVDKGRKDKTRPAKRKRLEQLEQSSYMKRQEELVRQQEELGRELRGETINLPGQDDLMQVSGVEERIGMTNFSQIGSPGMDIPCPSPPMSLGEMEPPQSPSLQLPTMSPAQLHNETGPIDISVPQPSAIDISLPPPAKQSRRSTRLQDPLAATLVDSRASMNFDPPNSFGPAMSLTSFGPAARSPEQISPPMSPVNDYIEEDNHAYDEDYYNEPPEDNYDIPQEYSSFRNRKESSITSRNYSAEESRNATAEQSDMLDDESQEAYENRVLNKKAALLHKVLEFKFKEADKIDFSSIVSEKNNRKHVAQTFYSFLVLNKHDAVYGTQDTLFAPIIIEQASGFQQAIHQL